MTRRRKKGAALNPRKALGFLLIGLFAIGFIAYTSTTKMSADSSNTVTVQNNCSLTQRIKSGTLFNCPARGSRLTAEVERPFPNSNLSAFPDGKSCAYVNLEAIKSDGTFLQNEPLVIVKPTAVSVSGPQTTDTGTLKWCFTTTKAMQARIIVKVQSLPQVNTTFTLNFNPKYKIQDLTDRTSFQYNIPITFIAQVDPSIVPGLAKKNLSFTYTRRVNKWGIWRNETRTVNVDMACSEDGRCTAVVGGDNVNSKRIVKGRFNYKYSFTAPGNINFYQSYTGQLR